VWGVDVCNMMYVTHMMMGGEQGAYGHWGTARTCGPLPAIAWQMHMDCYAVDYANSKTSHIDKLLITPTHLQRGEDRKVDARLIVILSASGFTLGQPGCRFGPLQ
jgi:hypothetical protein